MSEASRKAVAIGGGTGLPSVLSCLLELGFETSAVVTMADDGGSSGVLREQLGMLPPGDVRNCLVAMSSDPEGTFAQLFQYRFAHGDGLAGHALGNLMLAALADIADGFPEAIEIASGYLGARGKVLPSTLADVKLHGIDRTGAEVFGQARLAANPAAVATAFLEPEDPPAYAPALDAIRDADVIVIGPGSLYTSLIPNFLVAGIAEAVVDSGCRTVYVCNVANMRGETLGLDAAEHVRALLDHGLEGAIDVAIVHACPDAAELADGIERVCANEPALAEISSLGITVVSADLADPLQPVRHSREALLRALREVL